jgi:two-component system, OmpR family, alkaline phosphatase synthesis response regulator PhoP
MSYKVLIVEDESSIRSFLKINFQRNNYTVIEAETGEEAIQKSLLEKPQIIILDVMLPGIDGLQVCDILRKSLPSTGIIMLTARSQDSDKISGLEYGADDYLIKPFNVAELNLRVKALLRRLTDEVSTDRSILVRGIFKIDYYSQKVYKENTELELTPKEYIFLKTFMENPMKAFTRNDLLNLVWGYDFIGDSKIVDVNIRRLRSKIEDSNCPVFIETVWGTGYRWSIK